MCWWLLGVAAATEPTTGSDPRVIVLRDAALYVVDVYVVRSVSYDLMGIRWTAGRHPPGTNREETWCVAWDRAPIDSDEDTTLVSSEWVVVDGAGRVLGADEFASLTGLRPHRPRPRGTMLGGVQLGFDREEAEVAASDRTAAAAVGLPSRVVAALRTWIVAEMQGPACSDEPPAPLDAPQPLP